MATLAAFIRANILTMSAKRTDSNPHMSGEGMRHWRCTIRNGRRSMTVAFSQGSGHTTDPTLADVLDCLASDASTVTSALRGFEEWANELGYDTDSRKAYAVYEACQAQAAQLERLLGADAFESLLYKTERL